MAIKTLSGNWESLHNKNVTLRDKSRKRFYAELGIQPTEDMNEIDIPPAERLGNMNRLMEKTLAGRQNDVQLAAITRFAGSILTEFSPGFMHPGTLLEAFNIIDSHPKYLSDFFLAEEVTSFEISEAED